VRRVVDVVDEDDTAGEAEAILSGHPLEEPGPQHVSVGPLEAVHDEVDLHDMAGTPSGWGYAGPGKVGAGGRDLRPAG
jgi:hypothetical protein